MAPNALIGLASAKYDEGRRCVHAYFSGPGQRFAKSYPFHPAFHIDRALLPLDALRQALDLYNPAKFSLTETPHSLEVKASTFTDLLKLSQLLGSMFAYHAKALEPERQFLLSRGWSYFDAFTLRDGGAEKLSTPALPDVQLDFLPASLHAELSRILSHAAQADGAEPFARRLAFSNLLALPPNACPDTTAHAAEALLENVFFRNAFPLRKSAAAFPAAHGFHGWLSRASDESARVDFAGVLPALLSHRFYNLGPETLNCACCRPGRVSDKNVLPDSLAEVRFLADGFYYQSYSEAFAEGFHSSQPGRENRLRFRAESGTRMIPVGPFSRGQAAEVPFPDAQELSKRGKAALLGPGRSLKWCCLKRESMIARELSRLALLQSELQAALSGRERALLAERGLSASDALAKEAEPFFLARLGQSISQLVRQVPVQLTDPRSAFYFADVASSMEAVRSLTLNQFKEFALERGGKWLGSRQALALFRHENPLRLVQDFYARHRLPPEFPGLSPALAVYGLGKP